MTDEQGHGRLYQVSERFFDFILKIYEHSPGAGCCGIPLIMLLITIATLCLNVYLFVIVPKGFFPQQDTGRMNGNFIGDQSISFQAMSERSLHLANIVQCTTRQSDTSRRSRGGGGGTTTNTGRCFIS